MTNEFPAGTPDDATGPASPYGAPVPGTPAAGPTPAAPAAPTVSPDGRWVWNGTEWVPNTAAAQTPPPAFAPPVAPAKKPGKGRKIALIAVGGFVAIGVLSSLGGGDTTATPTPSPSASAAPTPSATAKPMPSATASAPAQAPAPAAATIGDGMHAVGTEVKPGLYRTTGRGYWERLSGSSGEFEEIIANGNGNGGQTYVEIKATDKFFKTSRFDDWELVDPKATGPKATTFDGTGMYRVGVDIAPGTYSAVGTGGYWERLSNATGNFEGILANDNVDGKTTVTIKPTDKFFSTNRFDEWVKVG